MRTTNLVLLCGSRPTPERRTDFEPATSSSLALHHHGITLLNPNKLIVIYDVAQTSN